MKKLFIIFAAAVLCASCTPSMSSIKKAVSSQMATYPESRLVDIYKNFYQDEFGPGHMIKEEDEEEAAMDLFEETMQVMEIPYGSVLYEATGARGNYYRVSLFSTNAGIISDEDLFYTFKDSAKKPTKIQLNRFRRTWKKVAQVAEAYHLPDYDSDLKSLNEILAAPGFDKAVHHSDAYREAYLPHYRVVSKKLFRKYLYPSFKTAVSR